MELAIELRFRGNPGELRIGNQQLRVLNLLAGEMLLGSVMIPANGFSTKLLRQGHSEGLAGWLFGIGSPVGKLSTHGPRIITLVGSR